MGKKGNWLIAVKKAFSSDSKDKTDHKFSKSKKKWGFGKKKHLDSSFTVMETISQTPLHEEVKLSEAEIEQSKHAYSVALATAAAAEAAIAAAQAAAEVVKLTTVTKFSGKSKEEAAAIKIQTAFRGYLARRALRALRGLVRLKTLIHGHAVKRQATTTLQCMQTLARVQSQIRSRRIRMSEENQALQRLLEQKREKELETLRLGEEWDYSLQSKEQVEASLLSKQEASARRERALAYAYSHQQMWKNSSRSENPMFMDPNNPHWGWNWLERWMAGRPWESRSTIEKGTSNDHASVKSASHSLRGGEIKKAYSRRELNEKPSPTLRKPTRPVTHLSPSTPPSKGASPRGKLWGPDNDSRSMLSIKSECHRRHSIAGSSMRDDESLASSPAVPSYMGSTESARAKSRLRSPLGMEKSGTPEKGSAGSAKKRLSFAGSPAQLRRHSGPPKVDISSVKDIGILS